MSSTVKSVSSTQDVQGPTDPKSTFINTSDGQLDQTRQDLTSTPSKRLVLLFTGSFNPVTIAHLRLLELARDYYHARSVQVLEGIISPVSDSYGKAGLLSINYRLEMLHASIPDGHWLRVDSWEAQQTTWTRTKLVLDHHHEEVKKKYGPDTGLRLLSGADVVQSMLNAKVWIPEDINDIMAKYGVACINRLTVSGSGSGAAQAVNALEGLPDFWKQNVDVIDDWVINDISATNIRKQLANGGSVKYVVPDGAINIIYQYGLYGSNKSVRLANWPNENCKQT